MVRLMKNKLDKNKMEDLEIIVEESFKAKLKKIARSKGLDVSTLARMWLMEKANETLKLAAS